MGRPRSGKTVDGWLIVDKPEGPSSAKVVSYAKRLLGAAKVGHSGTLDPLASGVLPLAFGEATKIVSYAVNNSKRYNFTLRWGEATTTDDREGEVIQRSSVRPERMVIEEALSNFKGMILQHPPLYSALKKEGTRACDMMRAGVDVLLPPRWVDIMAFDLNEMPNPDITSFTVTCGKGTYIRSLARDLARFLGTCGHVTALRRTAVGKFDESKAILLDLEKRTDHDAQILERMLPFTVVLDDIPAITVAEDEAEKIRCGQRVALKVTASVSEAERAFCTTESYLPVALVRYVNGSLVPVRVFNIK